jgi:hypothetical protein
MIIGLLYLALRIWANHDHWTEGRLLFNLIMLILCTVSAMYLYIFGYDIGYGWGSEPTGFYHVEGWNLIKLEPVMLLGILFDRWLKA